LGKAVSRNKIKRRLREAYRKYVDCTIEGYDIIFVARKAILKSRFEDILICIKELFERSKLLTRFKC
jgi:ribonuclease P protein component